MQIQKIQPNQTNFGTKVYIESTTKKALLKSKAKQKFLNHINKLEHNGINDVFVIKHDKDSIPSEMYFLRGIVFEKRDNAIFKTPYGSIDTLILTCYNNKIDSHLNLLQMYQNAKYKWNMKKTDKDLYEKYLSESETINNT